MSDTTKYTLKIISGLHEGSILPLKLGIITLGSNHDCDIILSEKNIAGKHLELEIKKEGVFINLLGHPISLDEGKPDISEGRLPLHSYQKVILQDCSFSISDSDGLWATQKHIEYHENNVINTNDSSSSPPHTKARFMSLNEAFFLLISGSLLALFIPLISKSPAEPSNSTENNNSQLISKANDIKNSSIRKARNDVLKADIKNKVQLILQSFGMRHISIEVDDNGLLSISGAVDDSSEWELTKAAILQDISFVKNINDDNLITSEVVHVELKKSLKAYDLDKKLLVSTTNTTCTITGELQNSEYIKWQKLKTSHLDRAEISSKIIDKVVNISKKLSLSIQSVSIGKTRYFVSTSGVKYMKGSDLGNGYTVARIEPDEVILTYKNTEVSVNYADTDEFAKLIDNDQLSKK